MGLEDQLLKDMVGAEAAQAVPEPPMLIFPSAMVDFFQAVDPVSGQMLTAMVITSGNNALRVNIPMTPAVVGRLRELFAAAEAQHQQQPREEPAYLREAKAAARNGDGDGDQGGDGAES